MWTTKWRRARGNTGRRWRGEAGQAAGLCADLGNVTGQELNLPTLIDLALSNNPQTRVAWYSAKSAAAQLGETNSAYYPQVSGNLSVDREKIRSVGVNGNTFGAGTV